MRQRPATLKTGSPRGILHSETADAERSQHFRYHPSPDLEQYVEHYWSVEWDYRGVSPERVEILPHPSVHMTFDRSGARIRGVTRGKFARLLKERGAVFGVKFTPGGFHPFLRAPISRITDTTARLADVFGESGDNLARAMRTRRTDPARIAVVEEFLRRHRPDPPDDTVVRVAEMVRAVEKDCSLLKVEDLAARFGTNTRKLQRLFARYVGVRPKWVIQRCRLHEAAERLARGTEKQATLALGLGYADQAHFVHDFKAVVGQSPAAYASGARSTVRRVRDPRQRT